MDAVRFHVRSFAENLVASVLGGLVVYWISRGLGLYAGIAIGVIAILSGIIYMLLWRTRWVFPADALSQRGGQFVDDPDVPGHKVWKAVGGERPDEAVLDGPQHKLRPGTYMAVFRMKIQQEQPGKTAFYHDVAYVRGTADPAVAEAKWINDDTNGHYEDRKLRFQVSQDTRGANYEYRVRVGNPGVTVWIDRIDVRMI